MVGGYGLASAPFSFLHLWVGDWEERLRSCVRRVEEGESQYSESNVGQRERSPVLLFDHTVNPEIVLFTDKNLFLVGVVQP